MYVCDLHYTYSISYNRVCDVAQKLLVKAFYKYQLHAVSRTLQGRQRDLVLRHFVPNFLPNSVAVAEFKAALVLDTRAKKWKYNI